MGVDALVVVVALLVTKSPVSRARFATAAFLIGCCTLLKPIYAAFLLLVLVATWPTKQSTWRRRDLATAALAFAAPLIVVGGWLALHGVFSDMFDAYIRFTLERRATDPSMRLSLVRVVQLTQGLLTGTPNLAMALPLAALGAATLLSRRTRLGVSMLVWLLLALGSIAAQGKFAIQNYTWHAVYPPITLLAGIGLAELWNARSTWTAQAPLRCFVLLSAFLLFKQTSKEPLAQVARFARLARGKISLAQYRASFDVDVPALSGAPAKDVGFGVERDIEIAEYLDRHTRRADQVLIWSDPLVNYLSDRDPMTRITVGTAFTSWGSPERQARYRAELLEHMISPRAVYFGAPERDLSPGSDEGNIATQFPGLLDVVRNEYVEVTTIGDVVLFRRRGT